ncbi:MAG: Snf7 family protein [Candidatus Bathyarchaeota archaeon]|nr:Snf7 family protein [Candidatus Termiticorpusculum sp.]
MVNPFKWKQGKEKDENVIMPSVVNGVKPPEGLKDQIGFVTQRLDMQSRTLDAAVKRFEMRDADLFRKVIRAMEDRDRARANIYATELSEIRKVEKMLSQASLALQSVSMRLSTVSDMGDVVTVLSPARTLLNGIQSEMCSIMPEASQELGNIGSMLSDICSSTSNQYCDISSVGTQVANEEALKILEEAEVAAEGKLKDRLPEIMSGYSSVNNRRESLQT